SLYTLLSGRLDPYQPTQTTLAEAIQALPRRTTNVMPAEVLRHVGEAILARGFDRPRKVYTDWDVNDVGDHVSADETTQEGVRALDDAGTKPWLIWLHYFDVHEHHQIPVPDELMKASHDGGSQVAHQYRALLVAIDRAVAKMLDTLDKRGL